MVWRNDIDADKMDDLGCRNSVLHRLDARAKILTTIVFLVVVMSFPRHAVSALMPLFLFPLLLSRMGNLPTGYLLRKVAIAAPFAILVGAGNVIFEREPAAMLAGHVVTGGWLSFTSIFLRFILTVWSGLILVASTGMHPLCAGLQKLGMPAAFSVQLLFLHRYLSVIAVEGRRLERAVALRTAGTRAIGLATYGPLVGHWLMRSMERALRVHQAMRVRGFNGTIPATNDSHFGWKDSVFVVVWALIFLLARKWNLAELAGMIFTRATP